MTAAQISDTARQRNAARQRMRDYMAKLDDQQLQVVAMLPDRIDPDPDVARMLRAYANAELQERNPLHEVSQLYPDLCDRCLVWKYQEITGDWPRETPRIARSRLYGCTCTPEAAERAQDTLDAYTR